MVLVDGTDESSLKKGPGRDRRSYMPGQNRLVYIAGHRTTYLAPFSHINDIRPGDYIVPGHGLLPPAGTARVTSSTCGRPTLPPPRRRSPLLA